MVAVLGGIAEVEAATLVELVVEDQTFGSGVADVHVVLQLFLGASLAPQPVLTEHGIALGVI